MNGKRLQRKRAKMKARQDRRIAKHEREVAHDAKLPVVVQEAAPAPPPIPLKALDGGKKKPFKVTEEMLAQSRRPLDAHQAIEVFKVPRPLPSVLGDNPEFAFDDMDDSAQDISMWAANTWAGGWFEGPLFMGYPALSMLALMPEYRRMAEVLATECTRRWIRLGAADTDDQQKLDKITQMETELKRLDVRGAFRKLIEIDAFMGRAHLFIDVGTDPEDRKELMTSIGNGHSPASLTKFQGQTGFLRGVKPIEPVWCYPSRYNATNPLKDDWYAPQSWFCQGFEIHVSRLLRFVGREVPDLQKPAYMFGGVSLSQLMKPYVDRWISVVEAVAQTVVSFSISGIKTNMETILAPDSGSPNLFARVDLFNNLRNNRAAMMLDKDTEDFFQFNVPLSELEALLSKFQELMCSVSGEPVVKLLGIQPAGLNASSQGEITSWLDWCEAFREKFCAAHLTTIIDFVQLSLFGEVDPDITWTWESLRSLDPKEETERRKVQAEMDATYLGAGVFDGMEIRQGLLADPESPYYGIEDLVPDDPMAGMVPQPGDPNDPMAQQFQQLAPPEDTPAGGMDPREARQQRRPGQEPDKPVGGLTPLNTRAGRALGREDNNGSRREEGGTQDRRPFVSTDVAADANWVTVHPNGPESTGQAVMIGAGGEVIGGAGGKLDGEKLHPKSKSESFTPGSGGPTPEVGAEGPKGSKAEGEKPEAQVEAPAIRLTSAQKRILEQAARGANPDNIGNIWNELVEMGLAKRAYNENYGTLELTDKGREYLSRGQTGQGETEAKYGTYEWNRNEADKLSKQAESGGWYPDHEYAYEAHRNALAYPTASKEDKEYHRKKMIEHADGMYEGTFNDAVEASNKANTARTDSPDELDDAMTWHAEAAQRWADAAKWAYRGDTVESLDRYDAAIKKQDEHQKLADKYEEQWNEALNKRRMEQEAKERKAEVYKFQNSTAGRAKTKADNLYRHQPYHEIRQDFKDKFGITIENGSNDTNELKKLKKMIGTPEWKNTTPAQKNAHYARMDELEHKTKYMSGTRIEVHDDTDIEDGSPEAKLARRCLGQLHRGLEHLVSQGYDIKGTLEASPVVFHPGKTGEANGHAWQDWSQEHGQVTGHLGLSNVNNVDAFIVEQKQYSDQRKAMGRPVWSLSTSSGHYMATTAIHELAHAIGMQEHINSPQKLLRTLNKLFPHHTDAERTNWITNNISEYAATNIRETDAELAALVTSPGYKKGTLPKELEAHVKALFSPATK